MRAFVAVEITEQAIRARIRELQARLAPPSFSPSGGPGPVRMVNPEILHFTLQFLGDVPDDITDKIIGALSSVRFEPFDLEIRGVGAFPNSRRPRTVWVGGTAAATNSKGGTQDALACLAQSVSDVLAPHGYARDKPFRAHSTIFRVKGKNVVDIATGLYEMRDESFGMQRVDRIKLKSSILTREGPVYSDVAVVRARGGQQA